MTAAYAIPGHDAMLLRGATDESGYDSWVWAYCRRPDAEIAAEYDPDGAPHSPRRAKRVADEARNDDFWLSNRFEQACEDARRDFEQDQADAGRDW